MSVSRIEATEESGRAPVVGARSRLSGRAVSESAWALLLLLPALLLLAALFAYPLALSLANGTSDKAGNFTLSHFARVIDLYGQDVVFTAATALFVVLVCDALAIVIGGYLVLGANSTAVAILRWLYRWPLFIPFVVAAQMMRSFLAKNGLMNNAIVGLGVLDPTQTIGFLDWRGVIVTYVWKQLPFVALLVAGAMAAVDRSMTEAARDLGAGRARVLLGIIVPQVRGPLVVASVLTFVTLLSVLSVPMMINAGSPTMITVDMAYRITSLNDYPAANALGVISYLMTAAVAWLYLRQGLQREERPG
jgi:ABC-type spermidine/putrescine transport system permease subunit I